MANWLVPQLQFIALQRALYIHNRNQLFLWQRGFYRGALEAVATLAFGEVHGGICFAHQVNFVHTVLRRQHYANTAAQAPAFAPAAVGHPQRLQKAFGEQFDMAVVALCNN